MATEQTDTQASPRILRLIRPSVVVLCGPAACGKSTFAAKHFRPTQIISSDQARALVCDDERDQRFQTQAFALVHFLVEQRLSINRLCVVDSTALTVTARKTLLELARRFHVPAVVLLLDVPLDICLQRDAQRQRSVGQATIERQYSLFEQAKSSIRQEGFDQVVELSARDMDNIQTEIIFRPVPRPAPSNARPERRQFTPRPMGAAKAAQAETRVAPPVDRGPAN
jgi:protein phosphatase